MLNNLNWTYFEDRRDTSRLAMMHKIVNNLVEIDSSSSLIRNNLPTVGNLNEYIPLSHLRSKGKAGAYILYCTGSGMLTRYTHCTTVRISRY